MSDRVHEFAGDWAMIEAQLPSGWREMAVEHGLVRPGSPPRSGAKVTDVAVPLRLVLFHVGTNTSLKTTAAIAYAAGVIDISSVALHKWVRKLGPYMASLLAASSKTASTFAAERWAGYDIIIVDATVVSRPGSDGTTARVHHALRLTTLASVQMDVTDETGGETFRRFNAKPDQLWIGDRGYANPPGIAGIKGRGADVLVRYNRGSLPLYDADGERLDVRSLLGKLRKPCRPREWAAWVAPGGNAAPISGRLVAVRLPDDKADEARARLRREQGSDLTKESLEMADFVVLYTTVPKARLTTEQILELYGLRWQVELHIKRDKSIAGLDQLPNFRPDTVYTWICAKMLLTQIARAIPTPDVAIPPSGGRKRATSGRTGAVSSVAAPKAAKPRGQSSRGAMARDDLRMARHLRRPSAHRVA